MLSRDVVNPCCMGSDHGAWPRTISVLGGVSLEMQLTSDGVNASGSVVSLIISKIYLPSIFTHTA